MRRLETSIEYKEKTAMKRFLASLLAMLLALTMLAPMSASAEDLDLEVAQNAANEEGLDLPEVAADIDLTLDNAIILDDLQSLQEDQGEIIQKPQQDMHDAPEADSDSSNARKYGVPSTLTLGVKETYAIRCTKSGKLTYRTSSKKIATVNSKGVVTGRKKGSATITVYLRGKKLTTCKVKVKAAPKKVTLNRKRLSLNVKRTFQLVATVNSGSHARYTWSSSNKSVATVSATGLVTAKKAGAATITVKTHNGKKSTCKVKVTKTAASTLRVSPTSMTLHEGESQDATVTFNASGSVYYEISDEDIVTLEQASGWYGDDVTMTVYAHSAGTATIAFTNNVNDDTAILTVTVEAEEEEEDYGGGSLSVNPTHIDVPVYGSRDVIVTYTDDGTVGWNSSDEAVATCERTSDWYGDDTTLTVYGHSAGTAVITITSDTDYDSACVYVTVTQDESSDPEPGPEPEPEPEDEGSDSTVQYRALLIGEEHFPAETCARNRGDVTRMNNMLNSIKGPAGGKYSVTCRYDLNLTGVRSAISNAFYGADDNDVSLFFIATHGDSSSNGSDAGALALTGSTYEEQWLIFEDLANALKAVPGKVIVIVESCGSGAAIYAPGISENSANALRNAAISLDNALIDAFSSADPGIRVRVSDSERRRRIAKGQLAPNTGELRVENKFYVLTASRYHEDSYGFESYSDSYNYFTKWLTDGIGTSGRMPADANYDNETTLSELFNYISRVGDNYPFNFAEGTFYQHVQVYPKNSPYGLFRR